MATDLFSGFDRFKFLYFSLLHIGPRVEYSIKPRNCDVSLLVRSGSSDASVLAQIFFEEEYKPLLTENDVNSVVDCGANVGYSSAWFLTKFPNCRVIAIEPESENCNMLKRNLKAFGS